MNNAFGRQFLVASVTDAGVWNRAKFEDLIDLIGARRANDLAARFRSDLRTRFVDVINRELTRRDAHAVTSTSELLGFEKLSQAARRLEAAFEAGEALETSFHALMVAKGDAILALDDSLARRQMAT